MNIKNFYPTPKHLIKKMLSGIELSNKLILEPSAGKGDIVDCIYEEIKSSYYRKYVEIDCIEIENELQSILKGKGYKVIFDDFLTFQTYKKYDIIVMNPPFDNGEKHLLKAIEMQKDGGMVICLLNAETLNNLYSNSRKELDRKLQEFNAEIMYLENEFNTSDTFRKTGVEIALIKIDIPIDTKKDSDILNDLKRATYYTTNDEEIENQLISGDFLEGLIQQYNFEMNVGIKFIREFEGVKHLFPKGEHGGNILNLSVNYDSKEGISGQNIVNDFAELVRNKYWRLLFESKQFIEISTSSLRQEYYNKLSTLKDYEFNMYNINQIQFELKSHLYKSVEDTIIKLFDELSYQSSYDNDFSKNIHYYNGWKTNKSWCINKKVILRLNGFDTWNKSRAYFKWTFKDKIDDIEKVFRYLDNSMMTKSNLEKILEIAQKENKTQKIQCKYFDITVYKKGTTHIEFKDLDLLKRFNIFGSQKKGWLPPSFAKKNYNSMTKEEQSVIDEFCGEEEYQEIYERPDYYLYSPQNMKLLA